MDRSRPQRAGRIGIKEPARGDGAAGVRVGCCQKRIAFAALVDRAGTRDHLEQPQITNRLGHAVALVRAVGVHVWRLDHARALPRP